MADGDESDLDLESIRCFYEKDVAPSKGRDEMLGVLNAPEREERLKKVAESIRRHDHRYRTRNTIMWVTALVAIAAVLFILTNVAGP